MQKKCYLFYSIFIVLFVSCSHGLKDKPLTIEQIVGTYDIDDTKEKLTLNTNLTYEHIYYFKDTLKYEIGNWEYFRVIGRNEVVVYDITYVSNGNYKKLNSKHFILCKIWGKVKLTRGYAGDPDGAPMLKWYKKVEEK
jgi:hypothetical protein